jgi:hypothetical protein
MSEKKYEVTEKGKDLFGNKKYEVTEKKGNDNEATFGQAIIIYILTNLVTGLYTLIIYRLLINKDKNEDEVFMKSSGYSLLFFIITLIFLIYKSTGKYGGVYEDWANYLLYFIFFSVITGIITSLYRFIKLWNEN